MQLFLKITYCIVILTILIFSLFLHLNKVYNNELNRVLNKMVPTLQDHNFAFISGDKDVTNNINFPTAISLELKPGDSFSGTFITKNHQKNKKTLNLSIDEFKGVNENVTEGLAVPELKFIHAEEFDLEEESMEIIKYTVNVPKNTREGQYNSLASIILRNSGFEKSEESASLKLQSAIGIGIQIRVSDNPNNHKYSPLISEEPYRIAKQLVISQTIRIGTFILAFLSLFFLFRHFRRRLCRTES